MADMQIVEIENNNLDETITKTPIEGVLIVERKTFPDGRGFFRETYRLDGLTKALGYEPHFVQENHSKNDTRYTLRGIHVAPWDKFVYVPDGRVQQVVVDLRENSKTFGEYYSIELGDTPDPDKPELARHAKVFIPAGCGNAYLVLSDKASYLYQVTDYWYPNSEWELRWNDPDINVRWHFVGDPIISPRDQKSPLLKDLFPGKFKK